MSQRPVFANAASIPIATLTARSNLVGQFKTIADGGVVTVYFEPDYGVLLLQKAIGSTKVNSRKSGRGAAQSLREIEHYLTEGIYQWMFRQDAKMELLLTHMAKYP